MTDAVTVALIAAGTSTVGVVLNGLVLHTITKVKVEINHRMDQLLTSREDAAFKKGALEEKGRQHEDEPHN
jgi:hypothetical protein